MDVSMAFASNRQSGHRIWLMHAGWYRFPARSAPDLRIPAPFWTPDSATIVFLSGVEVRQVNADGTAERSLKGHWPPRAGEPAKTFIPRALSRHGLVAGFEELDARRGGGWRLAVRPARWVGPPKPLGLTHHPLPPLSRGHLTARAIDLRSGRTSREYLALSDRRPPRLPS